MLNNLQISEPVRTEDKELAELSATAEERGRVGDAEPWSGWKDDNELGNNLSIFYVPPEKYPPKLFVVRANLFLLPCIFSFKFSLLNLKYNFCHVIVTSGW